jgi:hypothetical protein
MIFTHCLNGSAQLDPVKNVAWSDQICFFSKKQFFAFIFQQFESSEHYANNEQNSK